MPSLLPYTIAIGLLLGIYYAFMALGLNLVFGVVRMINLSHGDIVMLGSYMAYYFLIYYSIKVGLSFVIAFPIFFLLGILIYFAFVPKLESSNDPEMNSFTAFFGLSLAIEAISFLIFGNYYHALPNSALLGGSFTLFGFRTPKIYLAISALSVIILAITYLYLNKTMLGKATKALMQNKEQAISFGINPRWVTLITFAYGFGVAGMAGAIGPYILGTIYPSMGDFITILAFTIVIIGALGNPLSTIIGGLVFGVFYELLQVYISGLSLAITFFALLAIVVIRPGGILGGVQREV
ncbi:branched-chain amino acid ABC transporter permease [Caldisphaera lagunensis]|uniref:branched-chain amino acid ABC transporter permease n=1 Tax=Caldisphaera lagunensis TaxID=200415 RepID=UPI001FDFCBFF|nr:branched-chain amino acid ABC transporter permease [Caldisphaera lagunensis]